MSTADGIEAWINITPASTPESWKNLTKAKPTIGPIIGLAFVKFFNLSGIEAGVMFIQASMPSAVLTFLISEIYSPKKISNSIASTVALSTFMSFFTLIVVVFIALKYFN